MLKRKFSIEEIKSFSIVVDKDVSECVKYAAILLQEYFLKTTGVRLEVRDKGNNHSIFVGKGIIKYSSFFNKEMLKDDAFYCCFYGGNFYLVGKNDRATLYATWYFIDKYLEVKYLYGDAEFVKKLDKVSFPKFDYLNPPFNYRSYLSYDTYNDKEPNEDILINVVKTGTKDYFTDITEKYGSSVGIYGRDKAHNFHCYVPICKYLKSNPEFYYFLNDGNGEPTIDITNGLNDDGSFNKEKKVSVVGVVIEELKKDIIEHPNVNIFVLTQEDGSDFFNDDHNRELEKKYKRSGMLIRFCNVIIREINSWAKKELNGRQVKLLTFSYDYTKEAPVKYENGKIVPIDNTCVCDENLIIQMAYFPNGFYDYFSKKQFDEIRKNMKEWKVVSKDIWFWGYDISFYNYFVLYDSFHNIKRNIDGLKKYGVSCLYVQGAYNQTFNWQTQIRGYVYRKLMMGYKESPKKLLNEYLDLYYGVASTQVRKVISAFHNNYLKICKNGYDLKFECVNYSNHIIYKNNPLSMLKYVVKLLEIGENLIIESTIYSDIQKREYIKRLNVVKATPINLMYINGDYNGVEGGKEELEKQFLNITNKASINNCAETLDFDVFTKFIREEFNEKIEELS